MPRYPQISESYPQLCSSYPQIHTHIMHNTRYYRSRRARRHAGRAARRRPRPGARGAAGADPPLRAGRLSRPALGPSSARSSTCARWPRCWPACASCDPAPLTVAREPAQRLVGNCRDHAVLFTSLLRQQGVPARVRVGFATYLTDRIHCDHWIVETGTRRRTLGADRPPDRRPAAGKARHHL